jgi:hypothetical protein
MHVLIPWVLYEQPTSLKQVWASHVIYELVATNFTCDRTCTRRQMRDYGSQPNGFGWSKKDPLGKDLLTIKGDT